MKRLTAIILVLVLMLSASAGFVPPRLRTDEAELPEATLAPEGTAEPTASPEPEETAEPTATPEPTEAPATEPPEETAEPTATPEPTESPEPTETPEDGGDIPDDFAPGDQTDGEPVPFVDENGLLTADDIKPSKTTVIINGKEYKAGDLVEYHVGDEITVLIWWDEFSDGKAVDPLEWEGLIGDLQGYSTSGTLYQGGTPVGTWEIKDGKVSVSFNDNFQAASGRSFSLGMVGKLELDPETNPGDGDNEFDLGNDRFQFDVTYDNTKAELNKTMSEVELDENGNFVSTVKVTAKIDGYAKGIVFCDLPGSYLNIKDGTISITDKDGKPVGYTIAESCDCAGEKCELCSADGGACGCGFALKLDDSARDTTITVTYDVVVGEKDDYTWIEDWYKDKKTEELGNTVGGTLTDANGNPTSMGKTDAFISVKEPSLKKTGEWAEEGKTIKWTITFNTGSFGKLTEEIIKQLNKGELSFQDILGPGLNPPSGETGWEEWENNTHKKEWTLEEFGVPAGPLDDGSYTYTYTYYTDVDNDREVAFDNTVSTDFGGLKPDGGYTSTGTVVNFDLQLTKTFDEEIFDANINEDGMMQWSVTFVIPDDVDFKKLTVTDTPLSDSSGNKTDYDHQVVKDSVRIYVDGENDSKVEVYPADGAALPGIEVTYPGDQWQIIINGEYSEPNEFYTAHAGETITVVFQTWALDDDLKIGNKNSLTGYYIWRNQVSADIDGVSAPDASAMDSPTGDGLQKMSGSNLPDSLTSSEKGVFTWGLQITGSNLVRYNKETGKFEGSGDGYTIEINDKIPDGLVYVEGTAHAVLYYMGIRQNDDGSVSRNPGTVSSTQEKLSACLEPSYDKATNTLHFTWKGEAGLIASLNDGLVLSTVEGYDYTYNLLIYYDTKVDPTSKFIMDNQGVTVTFTNTAEGTIDDGAGGVTDVNGTSKRTYTVGKTLKKDRIYDKGENIESLNSWFAVSSNGNYNMLFTITINQGQLTLGTGGKLMIVDRMNPNLELIVASVELRKYSSMSDTVGTVVPRKDYYLSYDEASNVLTLRVDDGEYYTLSYYATIVDPDKLSGVGNEVEISGSGIVPGRTENTYSGALRPLSQANSSTTTLSIVKYWNDPDLGMVTLDGAKYELVPVTYNPATGIFTPEAGRKPVTGAVADRDSAETLFNFNVNKDDATTFSARHIFRLTETTAPPGFRLAEKPIYFIFSTYPGDRSVLPGYVQVIDISGGMIYLEDVPATGDLTVRKTVTGAGGDADREFHFTVTLEDTSVNGKYGDMTFVNGVAQVTLKNGESATADHLFEDLKEGKYSYTVTEKEANQGGYTTTVTGGTGKLEDGGEAVAAFTNDNPTAKATPTPKRSPNTGDEAAPGLWLWLMAASALGLSALTLRRKKSR